MRKRDADVTRQSILEHARHLFASNGFRTVTVKQIADAAGVSPNLITRYYGGKDGLFAAASEVGLPVAESIVGDMEHLGARLAAGIVARWSAQEGEDPLLILQRAAGERPEAAETLSLFLDANSLLPLERCLRDNGLPETVARDRAAAVDAFVLGVSTRRRLLRSELGDPDHLLAWLALSIQRLIDSENDTDVEIATATARAQGTTTT